jgi:hypothetical protein
MDFNTTIDLIIKDLNEAREIIDDLKKYPGVPALQVELAKSKCKSAGEVIALLKSLTNNVSAFKEEPIQSQQKHQPQLKMEKKPSVRPVKINAPPEEKKIETNSSEIITSPVTKKEGYKNPPKKATESTILADKFGYLSGSMNEQLGGLKTDNDVSDILKKRPLTSLSEAIGVNDRFLFIREIFNENKDDYTQAISRLENVESLADARAVIMSYTGENLENDAVRQLLDLVKRKLISNE